MQRYKRMMDDMIEDEVGCWVLAVDAMAELASLREEIETRRSLDAASKADCDALYTLAVELGIRGLRDLDSSSCKAAVMAIDRLTQERDAALALHHSSIARGAQMRHALGALYDYAFGNRCKPEIQVKNEAKELLGL